MEEMQDVKVKPVEAENMPTDGKTAVYAISTEVYDSAGGLAKTRCTMPDGATRVCVGIKPRMVRALAHFPGESTVLSLQSEDYSHLNAVRFFIAEVR